MISPKGLAASSSRGGDWRRRRRDDRGGLGPTGVQTKQDNRPDPSHESQGGRAEKDLLEGFAGGRSAVERNFVKCRVQRLHTTPMVTPRLLETNWSE